MGIPGRFKVTVETERHEMLCYTVCTPVDARRAVDLAAKAHQERVPGDPIKQFVHLERLPGTTAETDDILDQIES